MGHHLGKGLARESALDTDHTTPSFQAGEGLEPSPPEEGTEVSPRSAQDPSLDLAQTLSFKLDSGWPAPGGLGASGL